MEPFREHTFIAMIPFFERVFKVDISGKWGRKIILQKTFGSEMGFIVVLLIVSTSSGLEVEKVAVFCTKNK